jgi:hypothetical protein
VPEATPVAGEEVATMRLHASITEGRVIEAVEEQMFGLENPGFCLACGEDADGCEPDARNYPCESCGQREVFGASEVLQMIA